MLDTKKGDIPLMNIYLTDSCNMDCKYCFEKNNVINENKESLDDTVEKINKILKNYKIVNLELSGREISTCYKDYDYVLSKLTKDCKINSIGTVTNGLAVDDGFIDFIKKYKINTVVVSLDIGKRVHDINRVDKFGNKTYDRIFRNIIKLRESEISIKISSVYDPAFKPTEMEFKEQVASLNAIGVSSMKIAFKNDLEHELNDDVEYIHNLYLKALEFMDTYNIFMILKLGSGIDLTRIKEYSSKTFTIDCNARRSATISRGKEVYSCMLALGDKNSFVNKKFFEVKNVDGHKGNSFMKDLSKQFECMSCKINVFCRGACPILYIGDGKNVCIEKRKTHTINSIKLWKKIMSLDFIEEYILYLNKKIKMNLTLEDIGEFKKVVDGQYKALGGIEWSLKN